MVHYTFIIKDILELFEKWTQLVFIFKLNNWTILTFPLSHLVMMPATSVGGRGSIPLLGYFHFSKDWLESYKFNLSLFLYNPLVDIMRHGVNVSLLL